LQKKKQFFEKKPKFFRFFSSDLEKAVFFLNYKRFYFIKLYSEIINPSLRKILKIHNLFAGKRKEFLTARFLPRCVDIDRSAAPSSSPTGRRGQNYPARNAKFTGTAHKCSRNAVSIVWGSGADENGLVHTLWAHIVPGKDNAAHCLLRRVRSTR